MSEPAEELLDTRGSLCPQPIIDLAALVKELAVGAVVRIVSDDAAFPFDLDAWCRGMRHELLSMTQEGRVHTGLVRKSHD